MKDALNYAIEHGLDYVNVGDEDLNNASSIITK